MSGRTGRLRRSDRLLSSRDFKRVTRQGSRMASRSFVVLITHTHSAGRGAVCRRGAAGSSASKRRLGITTSRRVGNAVVRNWVRRSVREWFRRCRHNLESDIDIVVIARRGAGELASAEIGRQLCKMLNIDDAARTRGP